MRELLKSVLSMGITVGLSDREAFVNQVSGIIEKYQHDPAKAEKLAEGVIAYLENMRNNINVEESIRGAVKSSALPDKGEVEELTKAIKELTRELQNKK